MKKKNFDWTLKYSHNETRGKYQKLYIISVRKELNTINKEKVGQ